MDSQSPLVFTNFEWTDSSKEEFATETAEEIGDSVQPTFQSSFLRATSTTKTAEETENNTNGTTEAAIHRSPRDDEQSTLSPSTISVELTSLTDITQTESAIRNDLESEETTQSHQTMTQHGQHIAQDNTPTTHADFVFVSQQQSLDTDVWSTSGVTSKLIFDVSEELTQSSNTMTSIDSTSEAPGPTSDDSNLMSTAETVAVDGGVRSSADHSQSRLNDSSSAGVAFSERFSLVDSTAEYTGATTAHESSETSVFADNKTSSAQVPSDDDAVSTQDTKHTSTLDTKISEHAVSTDAQEDPVSIGTSGQYAWKTSAAAETTFQPGSTSSSAERLTTEGEGPGPGASSAAGVAGYVVAASVVGVVVLIAILCVVVIIYRRRRRKSCDLADQDLKDYRSLMKIPSRNQTTDGFTTTPYGAFPYSPFAEFTTEEDGSNSPFSATNFRPRFDHEPNGTSTQKNGFESEKEIPLQELCEEPSSAAGYSEAFSVDTFRPTRQNTADTQSEATNAV